MNEVSSIHAFTVDVEEYFHVSALERYVRQEEWTTYESRVDIGMDLLLDTLARNGHRGTFFVLGWVAKRSPSMVRRLVAEGHELASHGFLHRRITTQGPAEFRSDIRDAKHLLEDISGVPVLGYRAPSFSIVRETEWALDVLVEEGYRYDSSRFPISRRGYGSPHVPIVPHIFTTESGSILEIPLTVVQWLGRRVPVAGGGWLRQFPFALSEWGLRRRARAQLPAVVYIHPWELDPDQPRLPSDVLTRIRHYRGISGTLQKIQRLMQAYRFDRIDALWGAEIAHCASLGGGVQS